MSPAQNSPRGLFQKNTILPTIVTSKPAVRVQPGAIRTLTNSTGTCIVINTTGTTWEFINATSVQA